MNTEIEKSILENNNIVTKRKKPVIALLLFVAAAITLVMGIVMSDENTAKMPILLIGFTLAVIGIVKLFVTEKVMIYTPTGETIETSELYFEQKEKENVARDVNNGNWPALMEKAKSSNNLPVMATVHKTASHSIVICRAYQFVPYTYEAMTEYVVIRK